MHGRDYLVLVSAVAAFALLAGCAAREPFSVQLARSPLEAAPQEGAEESRAEMPDAAPRDEPLLRSLGRPVAQGTGVRTAHASGQLIEFAFADAPAGQVLESIVAGQMGLAFIAETDLAMRLTARTPGPVPVSTALSILNRAVSTHGAELVLDGDVIVLREAGGYAPARTSTPSVEVIALQHVPASRMVTALQPFIDSSVQLSADDRAGRITLAGAPERIAAIREAARALDTDWMRALSFSMIRLRHTDPDSLVEELTAITAVQGSSESLELVPLNRLQAVLAVTRSQAQLLQIEEWIARLDQPPQRQRGFHTIPVRNASAVALAEDIAATLHERGEGEAPVRVRANEQSNTLIVWGNEDDRRAVSELVRQLDILPEQILIEVTIAEVVLNDELRFGVQWFFDTRDGGSFTFSELETGQVSSRFPGFAYRFDSRYVQAALNALDSVSSVVVLSSPQIVTLNNRPATLQVGDQVPVITQSAVNVTNPDAPIVNSVQFRDTGVVLQVTPRISGNSIILEIDQEVSDVAETRSSGIDSPTIQQRRFQTVVAARAGETIALGGLIRENRSETRSGVPGARRVPLIGRLFETGADISRRTELIAFLTPRLVSDARDAREEALRLSQRLRELNARNVLLIEE
ncbi:secretin N-terminal domain-containing protein [Glycocaulis sp.]|uniref:secretin N-terminal domain-containing protein n=1 Tax=Glycocaulis sp. TaxID=1969725 RepID=UPI003D1D1100